MRPGARWSTMMRATAWLRKNTPVRFTASTWSQSLRLTSRKGAICRTPATLASTSTCPGPAEAEVRGTGDGYRHLPRPGAVGGDADQLPPAPEGAPAITRRVHPQPIRNACDRRGVGEGLTSDGRAGLDVEGVPVDHVGAG